MSSSTTGMRRCRASSTGALALNVAVFGFDLATDSVLALVPVAVIVTLIAVICWQTKTIRRREYAARPRPDYSSITAMERDIYGMAFEHDGAPGTSAIATVADLNAAMDDLAERATTRRREGRRPPFEDDRHAMQALAARRRADSFARRLAEGPRHPDTTVPAALEQYLRWLRGYVKHGGKPTHFYDYPFRDFRYAASGTLIVESDYEFGANSREIIVARGVETQRTNPAGAFGGWAHSSLYFMHGYRTNKPGFVPVYSDPEFDFARQEVER